MQMALGDVAAKLGLPVFPCSADKHPIVATGFKAATTDPESILRAFNAPGAAMIGMPTGSASGLVVVDVDIKNGARGMAWLDENREALPQTRTHKTRSGGLHLVFRAPAEVEIRNSASRVAPGVDVRGDGGYVILPPSPGYAVADPGEPAEMPKWLVRACLPPAAAPVAPAAPRDNTAPRYATVALDGEVADVMRAGEGTRNDRLNIAAVKLGGLVGGGLLARSTVEADLARAAQTAGLDAKEIAATIKSGLDYGIAHPREVPPRPNGARRDGHEPPAPEMGDPGFTATAEAPQDTKQPPPPEAFPLLWFCEIEPSLDARDFVQGVLMEQGSAVVYGQSNSGKTFWTTSLALHVAAGHEWCGCRVEQGGVVYCALEGGIGFKNRVAAWREENGLRGYEIPFAAVSSAVNLLTPGADTDRLILTVNAAATSIKVPVKLIVVDTLARALAGGNENAPDDMGALVLNMDRIRAETGAMVLFVHHSGKDQAKGARGHSSLQAAIDTEIEVTVDDIGEGRNATVVKQREMRKGQVFPFSLRVVELGENRHGEAVTTCVVENGEVQAAGAVTARRRLTGHNKRALEVLADLVATAGQAGHSGVPSGYSSVPEKWWRERFYERAMPGATDEAKKKAFSRAAEALIESHHVGMAAKRIWLTQRKEGQNDVPQ